MPATVIPLKEAGFWVSNLAQSFPAAGRRGLLAAAHRIAGQVKTMNLPLDRGVARAGWQVEEIHDGVAIFNKVIEAVLMEGGVRSQNVHPGRAMIQALSEWARRKGIGATGVGSGMKRASVQGILPIAWAIAKSMQKRGIFHPELGGLKPLEKTTRSLGPQYVREEVTRELKREFGG